MVQATGFYNTLLASDEPGLVDEPLNGYRLKERLPNNLSDFRVPFGVPELIREGDDVSVVTYGPLCNIANSAADTLTSLGIGVDLIDVRTMLPFDRTGMILESIKKTSRVLFLDEDVPGGATAFMMQQVLEGQGGYYWLDSAPRSLTATAHRPAYGSDGNYFSKPNQEAIIIQVYQMMRESNPRKFPQIF
jgi:pyruvate/2-oxoglutarate/acetoin dehydrogenase E1 component